MTQTTVTQKKKQKRDKAQQFVAMIGGFLGALLLALQAVGVQLDWFTQESIDAWMGVLTAGLPLVFTVYGVYKNQYLLTKKAKVQEERLKEEGLK
jgi:uncharacterized membrane protein